jgi:RNA polymerase-binding transcription factor DksA
VTSRRLLEERRAELLAAIAHVAGDDEPVVGSTIGETEHLNTAQQREVDGALAEMFLGELAEVDAALERIDNRTYGVCEGCSQPIAPERLEAVPATRTCVRCG